MPRPRTYRSPAERQAASRARHAQQQPAREDVLAALARSLHAVFEDAVECGQSRLPEQLLGTRADETLHNLILYLDTDPDPVRQPSNEGPKTRASGSLLHGA
jgi:hypothetical protein